MKPYLGAAAVVLLSLAILWLTLYPQPATGQASDVSRVTLSLPEPVVISTQAPRRIYSSVGTTTLSEAQVDVKRAVEAAFPDVPAMVDVVRCESHFRQLSGNGTPLISPTDDVGVMQINQVHWAQAKALGLDIFNSIDDNIKMGRIVYEQQGIGAWTCSR